MLEMKRDEIDTLFHEGLAGKVEEVDETLYHLGGKVYVTVDPKIPTVDIRHFWKPLDSSAPVATRKGVALYKMKWDKLKDVMDVIRDFVPELNSVTICEFSHHAQTDLLECKECSPFEEIEVEEVDVEEEISPNQEGNFSLMWSDTLGVTEEEGKSLNENQ